MQVNRLEEASAEEVRRLRQHISVLQQELARISSHAAAVQPTDEVQTLQQKVEWLEGSTARLREGLAEAQQGLEDELAFVAALRDKVEGFVGFLNKGDSASPCGEDRAEADETTREFFDDEDKRDEGEGWQRTRGLWLCCVSCGRCTSCMPSRPPEMAVRMRR